MNGLLFDSYWTIHITPESHCSYASFETNVRMRDYSALVRAVLGIFRPKRFTQTLFADDHGSFARSCDAVSIAICEFLTVTPPPTPP
jgi:hypothetical protein